MANQHQPPAPAEETITGHAPASTATLAASELPEHKRKYSRRTKGVQEIERGVSKAAASLGDAVAKTFRTYKKRENASSFKKRDGAVKDAIKNWSKAYGKGVKEASDVPYQLVKSVNSSKASKQIRDAVKMFAPPMFR
jgi:hypothetical protein